MVRFSLLASSVALALLATACGEADRTSASDGFASMNGKMAMAPPAPPPPSISQDALQSVEVLRENGVATYGAGAVGGVVNFRTRSEIIQQEPGGGGGAPPGTMMAYTYGWTFRVPTMRLEDLLNAHKKACEDAGPANCYVVNSGVSGLGEESSNGNLSLRATEAWVRTFEKGVADGLKPFDASVDANSRYGEDLTEQIVDGEARLKSITAFRDGLQQMLRDKPGRLSDLLEIQRTLANTQADIDSRQSVLAAMKLRVAMSQLNFSYSPKLSAVSESIWRPLGDAFSNFAPNFANTLAGIVEFIGGVLPVVIFGGLAIWGLMALWRWRGRRKKPKAGPLTPKAAAGA